MTIINYGCVFTTPVVSLNIPEGVMFTDYVKRIKNDGVFMRKILSHVGNLRSASARMKQFEQYGGRRRRWSHMDVTNTWNGERGTGKGELGTGNGELGTGVWELVYSGNLLENSKWREKQFG